jgi:hypothetical protein
VTSQVSTPAELAGAVYKATIREKAAELKRELIRQTLEDIDSWLKAVEVEWQRAHPEPMGRPIPPEELEAYRNHVRHEYYEWVEPAFERYLDPDPDAADPMIAALRMIESWFQGSQDDAGNLATGHAGLIRINDVRLEMGYWEGDLQKNFLDNFLSPLQNASLNQAAVAKVVREQLECNKVIYIRRRKGILALAEKAIEAVRTLNHGRDPKSYKWGTLVLAVTGTALGVVPGAGWVAAGALLDIAATIDDGLAPEPQPTHELGAPTAQEVAIKVAEAMSKMDADIAGEESKVRTALERIRDGVVAARTGAGALAVPEPALYWASASEIIDGSLRPRRR